MAGDVREDPRPEVPPAGATRLLLVRHAEVENLGKVLYGRLPRFGLSATGRRQAECLAAHLAGEPVAAIYSSPLLRARQTAAAIARHHPEATRHISTLLHEVRSDWQGTPFADFRPGFSTYSERRHPDDETMADIERRMRQFLVRVRRRHPGQCVVAVSHGDPITILRVALRGERLVLPALRGAHYAGLCSITAITWASDCAEADVAFATVPDLPAVAAPAGKVTAD